ncbi:MAG TPA: sulfur carrier protein ThiS [Thermoplasmatales archaeon]|nr:sulfur carrier protein ThiS [Thermoplasmatales archaeon]
MIEVNGRKVEWKKGETVSDLLKRMKYLFPLVIVKINGKVIPRKEFSKAVVPDNSKIDVIHMISGG